MKRISKTHTFTVLAVMAGLTITAPVSTAAAASPVSAPVASAPKAAIQKTATPNSINSQAQMNQAVKKIAEKLAFAFPQVKAYKKQKIELNKSRGEHFLFAELSKNGEGTPKLQIDVHKTTGELRSFAFLEPQHRDEEGDFVYVGMQGSEQQAAITDEEAKRQASNLINKLYGAEADYKLVSLWRESRGEKTFAPVVNFKVPVKNNADLAKYVSVRFGDNARIYALDAEIKPVAFDRWFAADLNQREMPNDTLSKPAQATFAKLARLYPELNNYPTQQIRYDDYPTTFTIECRQEKNRKQPDAKIEIDEETGDLLSFTLEASPSGKGASIELAKQKAYEFLQAFYGEKVKTYKVGNMVMVGESGTTQIVLENPAASEETFICYVGADGKTYSFHKF